MEVSAEAIRNLDHRFLLALRYCRDSLFRHLSGCLACRIKSLVRVDVSEEFPFLVSKRQPLYDR
jgi:hypothetical protein